MTLCLWLIYDPKAISSENKLKKTERDIDFIKKFNVDIPFHNNTKQ